MRASESAVAHLRAEIGGLPDEAFQVIFLGARHSIVACETLFNGVSTAPKSIREVARPRLQHNAAAVLISHNHPSGVAEASAADRAMTRRLQDALALIDLGILNHVTVSGVEHCSFATRGWLYAPSEARRARRREPVRGATVRYVR